MALDYFRFVTRWFIILNILIVFCEAWCTGDSARAQTQRDMLPNLPAAPSQAPTSIQNPANATEADQMIYRPYNTGFVELDLTQLEATRFFRSEPVASPDHQTMAYSEVTYLPNVNQTFSRLYIVPVKPLPEKKPSDTLPPAEQLMLEARIEAMSRKERALYEEQKRQERLEYAKLCAARYDPNLNLANRLVVYKIGDQRVLPHAFETLTVVDWSNTGARLLFKQRTGVNHLGLRTTDVLIYDTKRGTVTVYGEIHKAIESYWARQGTIAPLSRLAWDIFPLGWEPGSDSSILINAWAYDQKEKKFLGLWRYDMDETQMQLLSLEKQAVAVASNGSITAYNRPDDIDPPRKLRSRLNPFHRSKKPAY